MEYGICNLAIIPMRAEANDRSEQISQVLFGETFEITDWKEDWVKIITSFDSYTGWIGRKQFIMIAHFAYKKYKQTPPPLTYRAVTQAWKIANNSILYLPIGSSLTFLEGTTCHIGEDRFEIIGEIGENENLVVTSITEIQWGAKS